MAPMATSEPQVSSPLVIVRPPDQWLAGLLWLLVSVAGGLVGALLAWRIRALVDRGPGSIGDLLRYLATIAAAVILSGAQWVFLRRYRLEVYWWVPASVAASLVDALVVIPSVLGFFVTPGATGPVSQNVAIVTGALALAAAGAVAGGAQAWVLRTSAGQIAWAWIPATVVGGALAGALTTAISSQLFGLPAFGTISVVAAIGALLVAASQIPVLLRILR